MKTSSTFPIWTPGPNTRIDLPDLCFMHGGPVGMHLPEHEHREVQLELHFLARHDGVQPGTQRGTAPSPSFLKLIPSGKPHVGRWSEGNEVVVILLGREYIARATEAVARFASSTIVDAECAVDPLLQSLDTTLRREFLGGGLADKVYLEALGIVLSGHIARQWTTRPGERRESGRLTPAQLRRAVETIREGRTQTIAALAAEAGLGPHQFTRLFRQTTGQSPYQYIVRERLEKARDMLESTRLPLAHIALEAGFASQSHFTTAFRKQFRTTPSRFRQERHVPRSLR